MDKEATCEASQIPLRQIYCGLEPVLSETELSCYVLRRAVTRELHCKLASHDRNCSWQAETRGTIGIKVILLLHVAT